MWPCVIGFHCSQHSSAVGRATWCLHHTPSCGVALGEITADTSMHSAAIAIVLVYRYKQAVQAVAVSLPTESAAEYHTARPFLLCAAPDGTLRVIHKYNIMSIVVILTVL